MSSPAELADFDSSAAMVRALSRFLRGRDFPRLGQSRLLVPLAKLSNRLPGRGRRATFAVGGALESISPRRTGSVSAERIAAWTAAQYPRRSYPVVMVGSSCGAMVHLGAALGAPWLPQTFLVPVRLPGPRDDMVAAMRDGIAAGERLLEANPDLDLHRMHDASQDRLMVRHMAYFRVKRRRLGAAYERFLRERLEPGGTILLVDCRLTWPVVRLGPRHVFQPGAVGGATEAEHLVGGPRVAEFLARQGGRPGTWLAPRPNDRAPEAEWGFTEDLAEDVMAFAARHGFRVARIAYEQPDDPSPLVADLYRWWYARRRIPANRLLAESFIVLDPWRALRVGAVPFWMKFNMAPSAQRLEDYVDSRPDFDEIDLMLFANGIAGVGWASLARWRGILARARRRGRFLGVDEDAYPADFASYARYGEALRGIPARYPLPGYLTLDQVIDFGERRAGDYAVRIDPPRLAA